MNANIFTQSPSHILWLRNFHCKVLSGWSGRGASNSYLISFWFVGNCVLHWTKNIFLSADFVTLSQGHDQESGRNLQGLTPKCLLSWQYETVLKKTFHVTNDKFSSFCGEGGGGGVAHIRQSYRQLGKQASLQKSIDHSYRYNNFFSFLTQSLLITVHFKSLMDPMKTQLTICFLVF